jgi:phosphoenolpyruvate---glycerone phosphotransferase subunit DhaL
MNTGELITRINGALIRLAGHREELRDLDGAIGDGDLGITVSKGVEAVRAKLTGLQSPTPPEVLRAVATAFSTANPSTFAALVGGALLAGAKVVSTDELTSADAVALGRAAAESIASRGKSELGDKTVLDALVPTVDLLQSMASASVGGQEILSAMVSSAREAVAATAPLPSRRGRASWVGDRSIGHPDPGATAYLRFLEALSDDWAERDATAT